MIFLHISQSFRQTFPVRASEWALGAILFLWFLVLAIHPELMARSVNLKPLLDLMAQSHWTLLCFVTGAGRLTILAVNGGWRRTPHLRAGAAFIACFFWFQVSVGLMQAENGTTGLAIYPVLFFLDIFHVIRAMGEAGISDANHKRVTGNASDT